MQRYKSCLSRQSIMPRFFPSSSFGPHTICSHPSRKSKHMRGTTEMVSHTLCKRRAFRPCALACQHSAATSAQRRATAMSTRNAPFKVTKPLLLVPVHARQRVAQSLLLDRDRLVATVTVVTVFWPFVIAPRVQTCTRWTVEGEGMRVGNVGKGRESKRTRERASVCK